MSEAHDTSVEIDGDQYFVRRDFDLIKRIEQKSGPLADFDARLRRHSVTADDLFDMLRIILARQMSRPDDDTIRKHIFEAGIVSASMDVALVVGQLFNGNKRTIAWLKAEADAKAAEAAGGDENPRKAV